MPTPKYSALACGLFWAESDQDPADSENFYLSLIYKNLDKDPIPEKELLQEVTFFFFFLSERPMSMAGQTSNKQISALLTILWIVVLLFEAAGPCSIP